MKKRKAPQLRTRAPAKPVTQAMPPRQAAGLFPIVGIGASAGGLEALEQFLKHVPEGCGMAFVIVQHLDPTHKCIMVELLQRSTAMPVVQVKDRTKIEPNRIYVIPPNKDMSVMHGVLHLLAPAAARGLRLPIDFFFRTLAEDRRDHSIGVILSGMGTDGTLGLRAIKEKAGAVCVQSPASAKFDSMPRTAIEARLADVVAPAEDLPGKIIAYLHHVPIHTEPKTGVDDKAQSDIEKVIILLRVQTGHDFSLYKKTTVYRRIERRMGLHQVKKIAGYVRYLRENPQELELLFKELLIGVTSFFRDPAAWEQLQAEVIPGLSALRSPGQALRVWVPACSTGEEAYSLAIVFKEALERLKLAKSHAIQIFATDLDADAVAKAREAVFPANIAADVSAERLDRFFVQLEHGYQVAKPIRDMVVFAQQNIMMDPPFTKLDLLSCRNLLIYLTQELQKKLIPLFHYSLNSGGFLFLGNAETIGGFRDLFAPLDGKSRLYRRLDPAVRPEPVEFPSSFTAALSSRSDALTPPLPKVNTPAPNLRTLADELLLQRYSPPAVLVNARGDILYISGRTGKYLEPAAGKINWNLLAMAREGLRSELSSALRKALRRENAVTLTNVVVRTDGGTQALDVTVQLLQEPEGLRGMVMVVFKDVAAPAHAGTTGKTRHLPARSTQRAELERELRQARHELQTTREEMQTADEELKSSNEELQSTNEELQSANEELTTSKEEMQSLNEELQTVNHELQAKVDDLSRANNDMKNLLDSTDIATVFLDNHLRVRRFTQQAAKLTKLIPGDIGRPITDLSCDLFHPDLAEDVRQSLRVLMTVEKQVAFRDGRWYAARIVPYRTLENMLDGVVLTFVDITVAKTLEAQLRKTQAELEGRVATQTTELEEIRMSSRGQPGAGRRE
jgi:two-component system CheB/CheR fusion protein